MVNYRNVSIFALAILKSKDMKKIIIAPEHKKTLAEEFDVSEQSVRMSLAYVFNSEIAKKIRAQAKQMLLNEAKSIKKEIA